MLWKINLVFPLYAGFIGILLFSLPYIIYLIRHQKEKIASEISKREALEKQFAEMVQATTRLQQASETTQRQYQREIERLRRELTNAQPVISEEIQGYAFVAVNCSALAENLLESELFGHEKGAFTGAHQAKAGFFEAADKGTIFLDDVSATTPAFQVKLLRILQEGQYFRVGATQVRTVEVRVVTASNRPLAQLVKDGVFREDLYFRLNVLPVHLPPLRERIEDIPRLLAHFVKGANCKITAEAMQLLQVYTWPGNIRELQFRNDANTQIAKRLGHLHRSTVTEHLKGMTFLFFAEADYQLEKAIRRFNPQPDHILDGRVENRMVKYLRNLRDNLKTLQQGQVLGDLDDLCRGHDSFPLNSG